MANPEPAFTTRLEYAVGVGFIALVVAFCVWVLPAWWESLTADSGGLTWKEERHKSMLGGQLQGSYRGEGGWLEITEYGDFTFFEHGGPKQTGSGYLLRLYSGRWELTDSDDASYSLNHPYSVDVRMSDGTLDTWEFRVVGGPMQGTGQGIRVGDRLYTMTGWAPVSHQRPRLAPGPVGADD